MQKGDVALYDITGVPAERARVKSEYAADAIRFMPGGGLYFLPENFYSRDCFICKAREKEQGLVINAHSAESMAIRGAGNRASVFDVATWERLTPWLPRVRVIEPNSANLLLLGDSEGDVMQLDSRTSLSCAKWTLGHRGQPVRRMLFGIWERLTPRGGEHPPPRIKNR